MQQLSRETPFDLPIKFLQFGEGNFLRAFVDWQIDLLNERAGLNAGVVIVRPILRDGFPLLDSQDGVYTTLIRGLNENGDSVKEYRKITCVKQEIDICKAFQSFLDLAANPDLRFVVSNTTEAGITTSQHDRYDDTPPSTYPAKLTRFLHERYKHFHGDRSKGLVLLPCELIDYNGDALKNAVVSYCRLWALDDDFLSWVNDACTFCSTLVDRIVTGYPKDEISQISSELGYIDNFLVTAEYFYLFVIQGPSWLADELKLKGANLNIQLVDDISPYKQRKVGILNGGHTSMVPVALMCGLETVRDSVEDADIGKYLIDTLDNEIIPALPLPRSELLSFKEEVLRRFRNPYIHHRLESITLNSWSKFAARIMPQFLRFQERNGKLPHRLVVSLAATMHLYRNTKCIINDDPDILVWFKNAWQQYDAKQLSFSDMAKNWLGYSTLWGKDLTSIPGLSNALSLELQRIEELGMRKVIRSI